MAIIQNLEAFVQSYPAGLDSVTDLQLSQNENGRQIRFTIGGVTIPAGSVATISGTKPDGVVYSNTGTIEGSDTVIFDEDVQMTAVFGTWYAKIRITNAGNTIASARVRFIIDKDPVDAGAIPSESQLNGLVAEAEEYAGAAEDAAERAAITYGSPLTAATASAMTDINRVYVYTGSESGYTYGNWYYYNGSAWVSGGVYNSAAVETDTTLTESGVPADAKATGDKIDELKDDLNNTVRFDIVQEKTSTERLTALQNIGFMTSAEYIEIQPKQTYDNLALKSNLSTTQGNAYNYKSFQLTPGKTYYITGYAWYSDVYVAYLFVNSNNQVIGKQQIPTGTSGGISNEAVTIPAGTAITYVNGNKTDYPPTVKEKQMSGVIDDLVRFDVAQEKTDEEKAQARANIGVEDSEVYAENVVAEYEIVTDPPKTYAEITETITPITTVSGKRWNADTDSADTQSNAAYSRFNGISQYSKIYVNGKGENFESSYPMGTFYDSNDNKISSFYSYGGWGLINYLVDVPASASYIIVNGSIETSRPISPSVKGLLDGEKIGTMIPLTGTVTEGAKKTDGSVTSGANYYHKQYNVIPDSSYIYVSGTSWGSNWPLVLFYNSSGTLVRSDYGYGSTLYIDFEISIPNGTSYFIVNMTHSSVLGIEQGVKYPTSETGKIPTKTQAEYNDELKPLIDKKYLFVGDSYAQGYSHDGMNQGWCKYVVGYLGLDTEKYKIVATGGYGFANGGYSSLLDNVTETGFTDIVVCGGYNDNSSTEQNIISGITTFKNKALGKWPDVKIHVGFIGYNKEGNGEGAIQNWGEKRASLINVVLPAYQKCITVGCEYLNNVEYALGESGLTPSDGYHPSAEGNQSIARAVANALLTGSAALQYNADLRAQ